MTTERYTVKDIREALAPHPDHAEIIVSGEWGYHLLEGIETPEEARDYYVDPHEDGSPNPRRPVILAYTGSSAGYCFMSPEEAAARRSALSGADKDAIRAALVILRRLPEDAAGDAYEKLRATLGEDG